MKKLLQQKSFFFDKTVAISLRQVKSPEKQTMAWRRCEN